MLTIDPKEIPVPKLHHYLLGGVGPRPIALASTVDKDGNPNLSPFSFFNVFSANPPIMVFSPARSGKTGATKNTFDNVKETREVVINVVTYAIVQQVSLASSPYEKGVNEFVKSGLTPVVSDLVKPFRVKESPVQFECKVNDIIELGQNGGAGNLVICEVVKIHINENVLDENDMIDQQKIDLVSRMGGNWYCRADQHAMFEVAKPITTIGIGVDAIPEKIRNSNILTGNELGLLGSVEQIPTKEEVAAFNYEGNNPHQVAQVLLKQGSVIEAWKVLLKG